ncbi:MAG: hypothetical protein ACLTYB_12220 [Clostridium paraputrificum]
MQFIVGKGDGIYLGLLNKDGKVLNWDFFNEWILHKIWQVRGEPKKNRRGIFRR